MDEAAKGLDAGTYSRTAHDLNEAARALLSLRDLVGAIPPGDKAEQDARIDKLRAESKRISEADAPQVVRIEISPEADGWSD
jgi:alkylhydroperoxidase family enzyme